MDLTTEEGVAPWLTNTLGLPCRGASRLAEGYCSYVYRATMADDTSLIVKHVKPFAARAQHLALDPDRLTYEHAFLLHTPPFLPPSTPPFPLRLPDPLLFSKEAHTLLITDHGICPSLKAFLTTPPASLDTAGAKAIGSNLGTFLAGVHNLSLVRPGILDFFKSNEGGRKVSALVYFVDVLNRARKYGVDVDSKAMGWFKEVMAREEAIVMGHDTGARAREVLTAGDFWPGNVLVADSEGGEGKELVALDFELAKPGLPEFDVGQMAGELWMVRHFTEGQGEGKNLAGVVLEAFLERYDAEIKVEVDWNRVAIRMGVHLVAICGIGWEARVGRERVVEVMRKGLELCKRDWKNDFADYWHILEV
ncbi:kinase-like domain-containing protein [Elsinoe ampelina]|uniref:Kinase-like domain-containing protein n=1 Tax=Elsinoe ampelina TaxID=302913 RepID=A0A6A6G738_9PEZI|nr:kinase-like domain-containing protein [Elsinoe ampelina]